MLKQNPMLETTSIFIYKYKFDCDSTVGYWGKALEAARNSVFFG